MATPTGRKATSGKKSKGGPGTGGGDSPIVVGGGGGTKRRRKYMDLNFDHSHFKKVPRKCKYDSADALRLIRINGQPKNVRQSTWMKVFCRLPNVTDQGAITITFNPVTIEFECGDFPASTPANHHGDDWYITGVYANGVGDIYQYSGGNTDCDIEINPYILPGAKEARGGAAKRRTAKKR